MTRQRKLIYVDPRTSEIKTINVSLTKILIYFFLFLLITTFALKYSVDFFIQFSHNSKIAQLKQENLLLTQQLKKMTDKVTYIENKMSEIEKLDDNIRQILDLPPINEDVRQVGIGGTNVETMNVLNLGDPSLDGLLNANIGIIDKLDREIKLELESYQKLLATVERREDSLKYLPAIKPVPEGRLTSGFGYRRHPILKRIRFHYGVDLAANKGTPIYAPADGYITYAGRNGGSGLFVKINHKYGFETRYGHMNKIYVRRGQFVKRGDKIGEVGNTGLTTGPHLHYEVLFRGKYLNPLNFILE